MENLRKEMPLTEERIRPDQLKIRKHDGAPVASDRNIVRVLSEIRQMVNLLEKGGKAEVLAGLDPAKAEGFRDADSYLVRAKLNLAARIATGSFGGELKDQVQEMIRLQEQEPSEGGAVVKFEGVAPQVEANA